jgi:anti-sigma-K factor RskA
MTPRDDSPGSPRDPELDALLGAYALDALDEEERVRVDRYIAANRAARDEVDELLESAASLALAPVDDATAPPSLWARIASNLDDDEPASTVVRVPSWRRPGVLIALGVAAAIAIIVLAASLAVVAGSHNGSTSLAAAFDRAAGQKGAREVTLTKPDGATVAHAVLLPDGSGYLKNDGLAVLPEGKTYQLWGITGSSAAPVATSVGVLGADPRTVAFHTSGGVAALGLSIEREPGAPQPTQPIYASATIGA